MTKKEEDHAKRDAVLLWMLKMPPKKHEPLGIKRAKKAKPIRALSTPVDEPADLSPI
jgi:hypothetical protein